ncbi:hypothetical protein BT96DRAFT_996572 [Gymnopus androsaceus JB14]|uniref:Uncharacterized protein n=1 Tax=Gymnopus androsaceus JB14 TaxID=1447944 RepID=A0A6A4HFM6_9AGAR|nr:hypothetical protein BT96DRAFT_996572 [Gymnopus androsaceus JB14]
MLVKLIKKAAKCINAVRIEFTDKHLSRSNLQPPQETWRPVNPGLEATAITLEGHIVPGTSSTHAYQGLHDINQSFLPLHRQPYLITHPRTGLGRRLSSSTQIAAILESTKPDNNFNMALAHWEIYKNRLLHRSQQVVNSPEIIWRLGVIAFAFSIQAAMATNNEFAFVPVTGTLTPGQVVTGVINLGNPSFTPSPFALVFSASDSGTSISSSTTTGTSSTANGTSTGASATPKSSSTKTDMTVGIAIGVVAFVAIFGTLLLVYMRRRRRSFAFNNIAVVSPFPEVRSPGEEPPSIEQRQTTLPAILNEDIPPRKGHRRRIPRPVPPTREPKRAPPDPVRIEAVTGNHREESMEVIPEPTSDDSGWRDLVRNETADGLREIIELPPDYSEV